MILTIDSGVPFGFALWSSKRWTELCAPISAGVCHCAAGTWLLRLRLACKEFGRFWTEKPGIHLVYFEEPVFFTDGGSTAVAASGSLVKLSMATGAMAQVAWGKGAEVKMAPVVQWKGQLPKKVVNKRICKLLKCSSRAYTSHAWDAVGIGLWAKGFF